MTRLVSGKVLKTPSANVSAERYQFIEISEAEPDLGLPPANGYVFTSDAEGTRSWIQLTTDNVSEGSNLYYTDSRVIANLNVAKLDVFGDVADLTNIDFGQGLIWDGNAFAPVYLSSDLANIADLALRVTSIENFTTANVAEASSNLYFTNSRVLDALVEANVIVNDLFVSGDLVVQGNSAILNVATLIVEDKNIVIANGAPNAIAADGAGITIDGAQANITYNSSSDSFDISKSIHVKSVSLYGDQDVGSPSIGGLGYDGANIVFLSAETGVKISTGSPEGGPIWEFDAYGDLTAPANITAAGIITADKVFANSVTSPFIISDDDLTLIAGGEVITFNTSGDLKVSNYVEFRANSFIGDEAGAAIPELRIVAAAGKGLSLETDADISGNNNVATFDISGEFAVPKSLQANSLVSNLLSITGIASFANVTVSGSLVGNLTGTATSVTTIDNFTTDDLNEGSANLYYTDSRVITAVTPLLTTANVVETDNLYYTNARVLANVSEMSVNVLADVDITDIALGEILVWDGNKFIPGTSDIALFSETSNSAVVANTVLSLENLTTDDLTEGSNNLYFTTRRAIDSFSAGRGIIITEAGTISSTDDSDLYNVAIDNSLYDTVNSDGKAIISINSSPDDASYLVHSIQLTNIEDTDILVSGNIQFASGQTVDLLNEMRMPVGSSIEILEKSLVLLPGDIVNLRTAEGNVSVTGTYESVFNDESFINPALTIASADTDTLLLNSNLSYGILETIKVVNLDNTATPVKIKVTDANNDAKGYLVYNLSIPQNSIVDVLQKPKRMENGDKLFVSYANNANSNVISVFLSGRLGAVSSVEIVPAAIDGIPGNTTIAFATTEAEGSTLYYTFTEV